MLSGREWRATAKYEVEDFQMLVRLSRVLGIVVLAIGFGGVLFLYVNWHEATSRVPIDLSVAFAPHTAKPDPAPAAAGQVHVPANLDTPSAVQAGAHLFRENCVQCHGAPGLTALVQGLTPAPPNLLAAGRRNDPAEVFLKIRSGIAGTAMPAFGSELPDQSLWSLAAFLHHSRGISATAFDALSTAKADAGQGDH
jgi:mono/diheme cytochrome c family protein